jgi:hypothetical protein
MANGGLTIAATTVRMASTATPAILDRAVGACPPGRADTGRRSGSTGCDAMAASRRRTLEARSSGAEQTTTVAASTTEPTTEPGAHSVQLMSRSV